MNGADKIYVLEIPKYVIIDITALSCHCVI